MNLEAPLALAFGALLEAARRSLRARRLAAFDAALAALLLAAVPWAALVERGRASQGAPVRRLVAAVDSELRARPGATRFVLLFGAPGLAGPGAAEELRSLCFGGAVLRAVYPGSQRVLRFQDLARRPGRNSIRPDSVYLALRPDLRIERAEPELLARELPRGFAGP
jgi:hypothetical protein